MLDQEKIEHTFLVCCRILVSSLCAMRWKRVRIIDIEEQYAAIKNDLYLLTKNTNLKREEADYKACLELCRMILFW